MRTKWGGVGGHVEVTRWTNADSDVSHVDNQLRTSPSDAAIGRNGPLGTILVAAHVEHRDRFA
jgi:hypothetical protein